MRFRTDLDALEDVVERLEAAHAELSSVAELLEQRVAVLHEHWEGAAAAAHGAAQASWAAGFAAMRAALADLRSVAVAAHGNYSAAADANLTLWRQVG